MLREDRESNRDTGGGVGGERLEEEEKLEREDEELPLDGQQDDREEIEMCGRSCRVGFVNEVSMLLLLLLSVVVEGEEVESLRSETFLPDESSPYIAADSSTVCMATANSQAYPSPL